MSESVNEARDTAQSIAPLPSVTLRAITAGTNAIRDAAILSSQKRLEASPLVRFGKQSRISYESPVNVF